MLNASTKLMLIMTAKNAPMNVSGPVIPDCSKAPRNTGPPTVSQNKNACGLRIFVTIALTRGLCAAPAAPGVGSPPAIGSAGRERTVFQPIHIRIAPPTTEMAAIPQGGNGAATSRARLTSTESVTSGAIETRKPAGQPPRRLSANKSVISGPGLNPAVSPSPAPFIK